MHDESYLAHHGVKGQKWGVRRYQNEDGSLNSKGLRRYSGRKGAARYVYDTNKNRQRSNQNWRNAGMIWGGLNVAYGLPRQFANDEANGVPLPLTIATAVAGSALSILGRNAIYGGINEAIQVNQIYNYGENTKAYKEAEKYLRRQGLDV